MYRVFYTFVIVSSVVAILFKEHIAILAIPAVVASALPLAIVADSALAVPGTGIRTTFHGAVLTIPAGHAQAGPILALAMLVATWIALFQIAQVTRPTWQAVAGVVHAMAVGAAV